MWSSSINKSEKYSHRVVVVSNNYLPLCRVNLRRALILLLAGKAEPLEGFSQEYYSVRSPSLVVKIPTYIRLTHNRGPERVWKVPPVNRKEVLRRDQNKCQYCGSKTKLTLDHVLPRSRGGQHTWDNVVIACQRCNSRKGDRTPIEAGMILSSKPKAPFHPAVTFDNLFFNCDKTSQ